MPSTARTGSYNAVARGVVGAEGNVAEPGGGAREAVREPVDGSELV